MLFQQKQSAQESQIETFASCACDVMYYVVVVPFRSVPFRSVPFRSVPCRAVPCRAVPCRVMPCRAVRCAAVLFCMVSCFQL